MSRVSVKHRVVMVDSYTVRGQACVTLVLVTHFKNVDLLKSRSQEPSTTDHVTDPPYLQQL
jgi:hypothetical protein